MLNGKSVLLISIITFCRSLFAGEIGTEFTGVTETTKYYFFNERQEIVSDHIDALQALNLQVELNYQSPSINGRILGKARSAIDRSVSSRTGFDWKQLFLMLETENFDFRIGKIVEHWGVMESRNLVDIINPLDGFENYYNKEKVAQNTVKIGYLLPNSQVDIYVFSGFTPTEFYQHSNRLQAFDFSRSEYEVNQKMGIKDYAIRASFYYGDFEFALSSFEGTNRTPTIIESNHQWVAAYNKASQLGVDATLV
ncbi:MAG: hypothetical protein OEZ58_23320, partial [Gammaproteobacteria bacterium]|nr:hypothetical protein [Gammaproteobacteria bacterium]